eukprot:1013746-Rhodomonas_salina.1
MCLARPIGAAYKVFRCRRFRAKKRAIEEKRRCRGLATFWTSSMDQTLALGILDQCRDAVGESPILPSNDQHAPWLKRSIDRSLPAGESLGSGRESGLRVADFLRLAFAGTALWARLPYRTGTLAGRKPLTEAWRTG